jgi:lipopolysaccharide export system permease protein
MLKKIDKLVFGHFLGLFFLTVSVITFIFFLVFIAKYFDDLIGKDLGFWVLAELFAYFTVTLVPQSLPLAILLSSLMTYGNLGEHNEITAIKCSGVPLTRALFPVGIFSFLTIFFAFFFNNTIIPKANLKAYSLLYDIQQKNPALEFKDGAFYNGLPGWSIRIEKKSRKDGGDLNGVMIYDHSQNRGNTDLITAKKGKMTKMLNDAYLLLELSEGYRFAEHKNYEASFQMREGFMREKFDSARFVFSLNYGLKRTPEELFASNRIMKNTEKLNADADSMFKEAAKVRKEISLSAKNYFDNLFSVQRQTKFAKDSGIVSRPFCLDTMNIHRSNMSGIYDRAAEKVRGIQMMLTSRREQVEQCEKNAKRELIEMHRKFTLSTACLIMFLIGAPLGAIIKKGGLGMPVLISIFFFIIFYVTGITGDKMAQQGEISVIAGSWAGNIILLAFGVLFMQQARSDSRLFDADMYLVVWDNFVKFIKNKIKKS